MAARRGVAPIVAVLSVLTLGSGALADIDTSRIDPVRAKTVLEPADLQVIDDFWADAVQEFFGPPESTSLAKARTIVLRRQGTQPQYVKQFSESAHKHIALGLQRARRSQPDRRFVVSTNLLILVDALKDPQLVDLAMAMLKDANQAVRYWAVRAMTNPELLAKLTQGDTANPQLIRQMVGELDKVVPTSRSEILLLIAQFAGRLDLPEADNLLLKIAQARMARYAAWNVDYELADSAILKVLADKIATANPAKPQIARAFAQLFSYTMQRYVGGRDRISKDARRRLAVVLVETEAKCVSRLLGTPQITIKRAIENDDFTTLQQEHDRLLGDATKAGQLGARLGFDYGRNSDGASRTAPLALPAPPTAPRPEAEPATTPPAR